MSEQKDKLSKYTFDAEEIRVSFINFKSKKDEIEKKLLEVNITDEISLNSAQMTYNRAKEISNEIEKFADDLKKPFSETKKRIETYYNAFMTPLKKNLDIVSGKILNYKTLKAEEDKVKVQSMLKESDNSFQQDLETFEKLKKLFLVSTCRIFGGNVEISGKLTMFNPLTTIESCISMRMTFEAKFPKPETFGRFAPSLEVIRNLAIQSINTIEINLKNNIDLNMVLEKMKFEEKVNLELAKEEKSMKKNKDKVEKDLIKVANSAMRGTRKTIDYQVLDISEVPLTYLKVDEDAIRKYVDAHREEIKKNIEKDGSYEPIKGIKFYFDVKVVKS